MDALAKTGGVTGRSPHLNHGNIIIAKNRNTFAKRLREMDKKHKADEKREAKRLRKTQEPSPIAEPVAPVIDPPAGDLP